MLLPVVSAGSTDGIPAVAVVGAGPAGLAAAAAAAERGFAVTLFERAGEVGGQFRLAMRVPGKEEFAETLRYFTRRLEVLGAEVRLGQAPTAAELASYDEVVVATGVVPRVPELEGVDHPSVASYADVLSGRGGPRPTGRGRRGRRDRRRRQPLPDPRPRRRPRRLDGALGRGRPGPRTRAG